MSSHSRSSSSPNDVAFRLFLCANQVGIRADFVNGAKYYLFSDGRVCSRDDILDSVGFTGFRDGLLDNPHRYRASGLERGSLGRAIACSFVNRYGVGDSSCSFESLIDILSASRRITPVEYAVQYRLGLSWKEKLSE